jgi:integrase
MRCTRGTSARAEDDLKDAMRAAAKHAGNGHIDAATTFQRGAELWLAELRLQVDAGEFSAASLRNYRQNLTKWAYPLIGSLTFGELRVRNIDEVLAAGRKAGKKKETLDNIKKPLLGVCGYARRHDALDANLAKSAAPIRRRPDEEAAEVVALTPQQALDLLVRTREKCAAREAAREGRSGRPSRLYLVLPDLQLGAIATGCRPGELLSLIPEDVVEEDGQPIVHVRSHLIRDAERGGLQRAPGRKNGRPNLELHVPRWSWPMWRRLVLAAAPGTPLLAQHGGKWFDESSVDRGHNAILKELEFEWVTWKILGRKTISAALDVAGLSDKEIAAQLGNTPDVVRRHYRPRRRNTETIPVLDALFTTEDGDQSGRFLDVEPDVHNPGADRDTA